MIDVRKTPLTIALAGLVMVLANDNALGQQEEDTISKHEADTIDPKGDQPLDDGLICLARTVYWEAKGEGEAGMEAVASVVLNRVESDEFPSSLCGVATQSSDSGACQFSWYCDGKDDAVDEPEIYDQAKEIARTAINGGLVDPTQGALFFHNQSVSPGWLATMTKTITIGNHDFYKP